MNKIWVNDWIGLIYQKVIWYKTKSETSAKTHEKPPLEDVEEGGEAAT